MALVGPKASMPLVARSKKQACVSRSSVAVELVSVDVVMRTAGLPALSCWQAALDRKQGDDLVEDGDATVPRATAHSLRRVSRTEGNEWRSCPRSLVREAVVSTLSPHWARVPTSSPRRSAMNLVGSMRVALSASPIRGLGVANTSSRHAWAVSAISRHTS